MDKGVITAIKRYNKNEEVQIHLNDVLISTGGCAKQVYMFDFEIENTINSLN